MFQELPSRPGAAEYPGLTSENSKLEESSAFFLLADQLFDFVLFIIRLSFKTVTLIIPH